jgi:hypothetical protein
MDYNLTLTKTKNPVFSTNGRNYAFRQQFNVLCMFEQQSLDEDSNIDEININSASFDQDTKEKIDFTVDYFSNKKIVNKKTVDVKMHDIDKTDKFDQITFTAINTKGIYYFNVNKCTHILFYLIHLKMFYLVEACMLKQYIEERGRTYTTSGDGSKYIRLNTKILSEICIIQKLNIYDNTKKTIPQIS